MSDVHQLFFKKNLLGLTVTNKKFRRISDLFLKIKLIRGQTVFGSKEENVNIFFYINGLTVLTRNCEKYLTFRNVK